MSMTRRQALKSLVLGSGLVLSSASVLSVLNLAHSQVTGEQFTPVFLNAEQVKTLRGMARVIIPKSDELPGAEDVPVVPFIDVLYDRLMSEDEKTKFLAGLALVQAKFLAQAGKAFNVASNQEQHDFVVSLYEHSPEQTEAILNMIESGSAPSGKADEFTLYSFLFNVRALTLEGYFQSELVGETVLAYLPIPGGFDANVKVGENTRAWSI
ncbi:gluconate 2-dehydrogenase subunit 3 family protein [Glaciecola siphonariae]|uniref:Gluconate 2-dehydrogenase subunit 3 family protein n=1 Tax=Glaciecola siphonariae TaxID=521012 RepID=A0ABV9LR47_9ALTE